MVDFKRVKSAFHDGFIPMSTELGSFYGERDGVRSNIRMRVGYTFATRPNTSKAVESVGIR
jgi:hypothetical protein